MTHEADEDIAAAPEADAPRPPRRLVAIVGRPNVGKSAIFNRLAGRRIAIVHERSGVTRDRLLRDILWYDVPLELVDTGGVSNVDHAIGRDVIEQGIHTQVDAALEDAAAAILVVDATFGLHPLDSAVANRLRAAGLTTVIAANKCDTAAHEDLAGEFARLGFPVFPVSALHGRGFDALMEPVVAALPDVPNPTATQPVRVAIVGRPNVGKSSYVNRLLRCERVIVSDVPGTTRDSIDIPFAVGRGEQARHYMLIDTAGLRHDGKVDDVVERFSHMRTESTIKHADIVVLMLDATAGPTRQDKRIGAFIMSENKACVVIVNKWDLAGETTQRQYAPALFKVMPFLGHCPLVFLSAATGLNVRRSVETIEQVAATLNTHLPTGVLNRVLHQACERVNPPVVDGRPLRLYYATQTGTNPLRIRLFVNSADRVRPTYTRYLEKALRAGFALDGVAVLLEFSPRKRGESETGEPPPEPPRTRSRRRPATDHQRSRD